MSNNELWCSKCRSNHHPAVDCIMTRPKSAREIIKAIHQGDYDNDEGELCEDCLDQVLSDLQDLLPSVDEISEIIAGNRYLADKIRILCKKKIGG